MNLSQRVAMTGQRVWIRLLSAMLFGALAGAAVSSTPARAADDTIGLAVPDMSESFWISVIYGAEDEAKKLGYKIVLLNAGGDANVNRQISQIQDLTQRGVGALLIGATNGDALGSVIDRAVAKGIPVIGVSSVPNSDKLTARVGADHYNMGELQAQCLGAAVNGKGKVAMLIGPAGQFWADRRAKGFTEALAKSFPDIKVVADSKTADNRNAALTITEEWIQKFPDLNGIYAVTDDVAAGAIGALRAAGRLGSVKVSASNLSPVAQQMLKDGELQCSSIQQIVLQGREAVRQAVAAIKKQPVRADLVTPAILVNKDNLSTVDLSGVVAPSDFRP